MDLDAAWRGICTSVLISASDGKARLDAVLAAVRADERRRCADTAQAVAHNYEGRVAYERSYGDLAGPYKEDIQRAYAAREIEKLIRELP